MKKAIIYQIGRFEANVFNKIIFRIGEKRYETSLSSLAIKNFMESEGYRADVILAFPVSLPFNNSLVNNERFMSVYSEDRRPYFEAAFNRPAEHLKHPEFFFQTHPHTGESTDFIVIHSLGVYDASNYQVSFDCHYSDIVLTILMDMIRKYLKNEDGTERYIIDISSGHNIYVSALLEASRYLGVWLKLYGWGKKMPSLEVAFSDPIVPGMKTVEHRIYFEAQDIKAFFSSPVTDSDIRDYTLSRVIYPDRQLREKKRQLHSVLENFVLTFSAIKNNTPLTVYYRGYDDKEVIHRVLNDFLEYTQGRLKERYDTSPALPQNEYLKILLSLGFYLGICRILNDEEVIKSDGNGTEIGRLRESFKEIYSLFGLGLNDKILGNEVDKIRKDAKPESDWKGLGHLLGLEDSTPQARNFFAHAGFEGNITECRMENGEFYLKYREEYSDVIFRWLRESV